MSGDYVKQYYYYYLITLPVIASDIGVNLFKYIIKLRSP